jgi:folate-binding protein YgfZ
MMISLPDLQLLEIAGADAVNFAHAQFSSDVRALTDGAWQWSAWLSPQGRVRAFFQLVRDDHEHLRLLLRGGDPATLRAALAPYVLRAKVYLRISDATVLGAYAPAAGALALPGSPARWVMAGESAAGAADISDGAREAWRLADIRAGLPVLAASLQDQLLPQWLGLDRLGAVSVKKGCYPGQEIMSRLHFKGGNKRSLYRIGLAGRDLPPVGATLTQTGGGEIGSIIMAAHSTDGSEALATLLDAAAAGGDASPANFAILQRFS